MAPTGLRGERGLTHNQHLHREPIRRRFYVVNWSCAGYAGHVGSELHCYYVGGQAPLSLLDKACHTTDGPALLSD